MTKKWSGASSPIHGDALSMDGCTHYRDLSGGIAPSLPDSAVSKAPSSSRHQASYTAHL